MSSTYRKALVSYIDILGFRDLIEATVADPNKASEVLALVQTIKQELSSGFRVQRETEKARKLPYQAAAFSDHVIRATFLEGDTELVEACNWEFLYLANKQCELACKGVLVRGGVCIGDIHADGEYVFGPALVQAYNLESNYAVFPRLVIDWDVIKDALNRPGGLALWRDYVTQGEDGVYFVNYLYGSYVDSSIDPDGVLTSVEMFQKHKEMLEAKIGDLHSRNDRVRQKYLWLGLYHNSVLKRIRNVDHPLYHANPEPFLPVLPTNRLDGMEIPENLLNL